VLPDYHIRKENLRPKSGGNCLAKYIRSEKDSSDQERPPNSLRVRKKLGYKDMILIRHGEKAWKNGKGPHDDPPLLPSAKETIISTSKGLRKYHPTALVCSPYLRCLQTARILQETFPSVPFIVDDLLHEYHKHPPRLPRESRVPKIGESKENFQQRIQLIKQRYEHQHVLLITHRPIIQALTGQHVKQGKSLIT